MKKIHEYTYEILRENDIKIIFGNPGSNEIPFLKSMPSDFRYILGLHEGTVVGMADGYAQATGKPVFINVHAAAGTGNAMGALTNAASSHTPLVVTSGQQTREMMGVEALLTNIDATQLPKPLVKWSHEPASASEVPLAISRAINISKNEPAGPVYVSVPYDDWDKNASHHNDLLLKKKIYGPQGLPKEDLQDITDKISKAKNIAVVLGADVDRQNANIGAVEFVEALNAPVWVAPSSSRCPFPTTHPYFQGILPASILGIYKTLQDYDLILVFGAPVFRYHQYEDGEYIGENTELLSFTCDIQEAARAMMGSHYVCNLKDSLISLSKLVSPQKIDVIPRKKPQVLNESKKAYLQPERLFDLINILAPEKTIFVNESTSTTNILWERLNLVGQGSYFFAAAGGLGFGMPAAVGIQLAHKHERRVVAIIGDGSANYSITALWTAAYYKIPVIFIILRNGTYGALYWFSSLFNATNVPGIDIPNIDFTQIAKGYGVKAFRANNDDDFIQIFQKCLHTNNEPTLIEVITADSVR